MAAVSRQLSRCSIENGAAGNSAHARDQSGDSLFRLLEKSIVEISHHVAVAVGIYESWRQGESVGIDHHARLLRILFPDGFDRSILNKDIRRKAGVPLPSITYAF